MPFSENLQKLGDIGAFANSLFFLLDNVLFNASLDFAAFKSQTKKPLFLQK